MKSKYKLLLTGSIIAIISMVVVIVVSFLQSNPVTSLQLSDTLFIEFLLLFTAGIFLYFKNKVLFKFGQNKTKEERDKSQQGLNLLIISLPLFIISIAVSLF